MNNMKCKLCSSETKSFFSLRGEAEYHMCKSCGFIFKGENYLPSKKSEKEIYDQHENSIENKGYVKMFERFLNYILEGREESIEKVLDFGSGPGPVLAELMKRRGYDVEIYDPYYSPEKVYQGKNYDFISSTEVFEHFYNPLDSIEIIAEHMKKGALLGIMTQFFEDSMDFEKWWYKNDPSHVSFYSLNSFKVIANKFNFDILKTNMKNIILLKKR